MSKYQKICTPIKNLQWTCAEWDFKKFKESEHWEPKTPKIFNSDNIIGVPKNSPDLYKSVYRHPYAPIVGDPKKYQTIRVSDEVVGGE